MIVVILILTKNLFNEYYSIMESQCFLEAKNQINQF